MFSLPDENLKKFLKLAYAWLDVLSRQNWRKTYDEKNEPSVRIGVKIHGFDSVMARKVFPSEYEVEVATKISEERHELQQSFSAIVFCLFNQMNYDGFERELHSTGLDEYWWDMSMV